MTFAKPTFLFFLLLIPAFIAFFLWAEARRKGALAKLGDRHLIERLSAHVNWHGRRWQIILWLIAFAFLVVALARPQWGAEVRQVEQEGLQVMVALDVSESMLAEDIKPNRLTRAKLEISDLMDKLNGDEIGLVLFSGASFIQFPLTTDYGTARTYLDSAGPRSISRPGTAIGDAIRTAQAGFDPNLESQKVLVIMTDGEDHETDPIGAAQAAAEEGILIYTIGFGTAEGTPVPQTDQWGNVVGYKQDAQGNMVLSRLDEGLMQELATVGHGRYFQASPGGSELDALLAEIDGLQRTQLANRTETKMIERYQGFLFLAILALVVAELIPDRSVSRKPLSVFRHGSRITAHGLRNTEAAQ
ncbi:MAG TPA: VWA domain-containing protein [Chloroflexota bacterium]|nr:VWA domain-containing protein [Chloroflexota bacterium]